jgi:uncharacterized protein
VRPMTDNSSRLARIEEFLCGLDARERQILELERASVSDILSAADPPEKILAAARHACSAADERQRHYLFVAQPTAASACHAGCHFCCYLKVGATAPEVLALSAHLERNAPREEFERIKARTAELAADPRIFSSDAKPAARLACPVLTELGTCAAYEARPLACRGWNSSDVESCRRWLDDDSALPPSNAQQARDCAAVGLGLTAAVAEAGLSADVLELTSALNVAFHEPNALERWLAGEAIFAVADR